MTADTPRVLITAGASGIGRAMAEAFSEAGARVWIADLDEDAVATCPKAWGRTSVDASDEAGMSELFARIDGDWGGVDTVCANAGIAGPNALVENVELGDWRKCVSINLDSAFLASKFAAPIFKRQQSGSLILTTSTAGFFGYPSRSPYSAAKWAVIGLMKTLAMELGPHSIRVNALAPGAVEGPRMEGVMEREAAARNMTRDQIHAAYASGTSMRTWVEGRDIANMAMFLASDAARFVSGQVIAVDGHTFNPDPAI